MIIPKRKWICPNKNNHKSEKYCSNCKHHFYYLKHKKERMAYAKKYRNDPKTKEKRKLAGKKMEKK